MEWSDEEKLWSDLMEMNNGIEMDLSDVNSAELNDRVVTKSWKGVLEWSKGEELEGSDGKKCWVE